MVVNSLVESAALTRPQTQCSKVLLCSLKVIFHCYFRLCFVRVEPFCFQLEPSERKLLLKQRLGATKVKHNVDRVSAPSLWHGQVWRLCVPPCCIFSFSLLLILSLFAVLRRRRAKETRHCGPETTVLCSTRQPIGRGANLQPTPEPWRFSKVSG